MFVCLEHLKSDNDPRCVCCWYACLVRRCIKLKHLSELFHASLGYVEILILIAKEKGSAFQIQFHTCLNTLEHQIYDIVTVLIKA
jgi:hypothetical protein